jgi:preprotein translocase subunit SecF
MGFKGIKLVPDETDFDFIGKRFLALIFSIVLIVGSIGLVVKDGLNFGIDFTGGTVIEIAVPEAPNLSELRTDLNNLDLGAISLQEFGEPTDLMIRLPQQGDDPELQNDAINAVRDTLNSKFGAEAVDYRRVEYVGPQVGAELKKQGMYAVLFSLLGILAYVWFRFEWQFGVAAVVALAHDAIAVIGFFALTQMEFNLSTVAAILMIAGYSINDTVVVFDRIRENLRKYKKKALGDLFNMSVNQMLSRTLMTSITTLLALAALHVFGGEVIKGFVLALIFGIVIGTYSSIYVASPVLMFMNIRRTAVDSDDNNEAVVNGA